jgi:hypothetical protein
MFLDKIELFGEHGVLVVPRGDFARLRHNPSFPTSNRASASFWSRANDEQSRGYFAPSSRHPLLRDF